MKHNRNIINHIIREELQIGVCKLSSKLNSSFSKSHVLSNTTLSYFKDQRYYVYSADLDPVEFKYLLVGDYNGLPTIFDTTKYGTNKFRQVKTRNQNVSEGNMSNSVFPLTCVQWFPVDAGLFVSTSYDQTIKIWDPNSMRVVDKFVFDSLQIKHFHMSSVAGNHSLIAAAADTGEVILCDISTGASTHRLRGHKGSVNVVQWTRHNQYHLYSGSVDGTIRLWDVRGGKSCLDIYYPENAQAPVDRKNSSLSTVKELRKSKTLSTSVGQFSKHKNTFNSPEIIDLCCSYDGLWLLSVDSKGFLRVRNTTTGQKHKTCIHLCRSSVHKGLSVTKYLSPDLIFIPNGKKIVVCDLLTGKPVNALNAHLGSVLKTIYNPITHDLYSFGSDRNFVVWTPKVLESKSKIYSEKSKHKLQNNMYEDCWSDDD